MSENEVLFVRSSKKNLSKSSEGDSSTNEDDIWDDTLLIEAYDKAVHIAQQSYMKKMNSNENVGNSKDKKIEKVNQKWQVGDKCRCQYSEDLKYYEADVIEINGSSGMCTVRYIGYENEEKVPLKKLKASLGDAARSRQCQEALNDNVHQNVMDVESESSSHRKKFQPKPKNFYKKKENLKSNKNSFNENSLFDSFNFPFSQLGPAGIPPPPPPHIFNNNLIENDSETEAMSAMLISWYMSGYHTGFYQGLKMAKKQ